MKKRILIIKNKKIMATKKQPNGGFWVMIILLISITLIYKRCSFIKHQKVNFETEILVYEDIPRAGKVLKYKGPTPYVFKVRYRTEIRPNQCGKIVQVDCHRWSTPFILYMPCNLTGWKIDEMPATEQWDRLTVTTVASK